MSYLSFQRFFFKNNLTKSAHILYKLLQHVMQFAEITQEVEIPRPTPVCTPVTPRFRGGRGALYREAGGMLIFLFLRLCLWFLIVNLIYSIKTSFSLNF